MLKLSGTLVGHSERVWSVAWSPCGNYLASCGEDKTARIWMKKENEEYQCVGVLEDGHDRTIRSIAWSPCGKYLSMASFDGKVSIWEKRGNEYRSMSELTGHENEVKCVAWDRSGTLLATCSRDKSVWIWEAGDDHDFECAGVCHGHSQDVKMVAWHPNKEILVSASYDDTIKVWASDGYDWNCIDTLKGHSSTVWAVAFNNSGSHMVSGSDDMSVIVWRDTESLSAPNKAKFVVSSRLSGYHSRAIYSLDWSRTGLLATGGGDDNIFIFSRCDIDANGNGNVDNCGPKGIGASITGMISGLIGTTNSANTQDPSDGAWEMVISQRKAHDGDVNAVKWNPKQNILASAGDDGVIKIWSIQQ